jgi:iron(III) transport system substrate-binding protein
MCKYIFFLVLFIFQTNLLAGEVNIYSARKGVLIKPLLDRFTEKTGITVNLVTGEADTLIKRLEVEGRNTPADLLITVDVARLHRAKQSGLFQTVGSKILNQAIPASYRDPEGYWYGLSLRSRVIVYAPDRVKPEELSNYEALAEPVWKGRLCVRSSSNVYNQSLVVAMIVNNGLEDTERWARGLVDNFARSPKGGDRDQIKAVAVGQCDVALVNTYYLAGMLHSKQADEKNAALKVSLFWPGQSDHGAHVNVSGAGVIKTAKHVAEAVELLEFMVSDDAQIWYAEQNHEYPVKEGIKISDTLSQWGNFTADKLNLSLLGENNAEAVRLMDRAGWK